MKKLIYFWHTYAALIITTTILLVVLVGGFVFTYETMQNQTQAITALSVKVDALQTQLQTLQKQNMVLRRSMLGTVKKNKKKTLPILTPTGFGI